MITVRVVVAGGVGSVAAAALAPLISDRESFIHVSVPGQAEATAVLSSLSSHGVEVLQVVRESIPGHHADLPGPRDPDQPTGPDR